MERFSLHALIQLAQKPRGLPARRRPHVADWLHEVVHEVNDRSPIVINKEGSFLGLAYDVRKAF